MKPLLEHLALLEKVRIGKKFTDFEMMTPDGISHLLSEYTGEGKIVLIDFWASWCVPCLKEIPNLKRIYKEYQPKNFEIIGISLDNRKEDWINAIHTHQLEWPQLSDLKGWDSIGSQIYAINYIPNTLLIDENGIIIAKNLRGEELHSKLEEIIK